MSAAAQVAVVGSINADVLLQVAAHPAPGETVLATGRRTAPGGKGANQAVAAARCGVAVALVGCVGTDDAGRSAVANLAAAGVDTTSVRRGAAATGTAYVTVAGDGQNSIVVDPGANALLTAADVDADVIRRARMLVAQLEVPLPAVTRAVAIAQDAGVPVLLNLAPATPDAIALLARVAVLVVNEREAAALLGDVAEPAGTTQRLLALGPQSVALTLGARGAAWRTPDADGLVPAPQVTAVDTTGAGDAFVGALAAGIVAGRSLADAVQQAVEFAAAATTVHGAQPPAAEDFGARQAFAAARVARLATVDTAHRPHLVPIVFAVDGETIYSAVDAKPKRTNALRRLANVAANPRVTVLADYYDDADWTRLWWVRADGSGRVLDSGDAEARHAVGLLAARYPQHAAEPPAGPVLAIDVTRWSAWSAWSAQ